MTREQYFELGKVHTDKDIEISPSQIKRIQNTVNDHTHWFNAMSNCGSNWGHNDRMSKNLNDKGEQVCPMTLLFKDHKSWKMGSAGPIPSRPVVGGNSGLNCHLSEMIAHVIEPITSQTFGAEIDSTSEMLTKIDKLN